MVATQESINSRYYSVVEIVFPQGWPLNVHVPRSGSMDTCTNIFIKVSG